MNTLKENWKEELKHEQILSAQKEGRRLARCADNSRLQGWITGICEAADFFVGKDRADIAQHLLSHFCIDRGKAEGVLQSDRRVKSMTLASLDRARAWNKPLPIMR